MSVYLNVSKYYNIKYPETSLLMYQNRLAGDIDIFVNIQYTTKLKETH